MNSSTTPEPTPSNTLSEALAAAEIDLPQEQIAKLEEYCQALWDWNGRMNLTRHTNYDLFVARDLVDTLQLSSVLAEGERVLDVGTGGGVPGLVLSIIRPDLDVTVCDGVQKKAKAVGDIASRLTLPISVAHARAEEILEITSFDSLTARAVGPMVKILRWFDEHWDSIGRLLLIKGPKWIEERGESRHHGLLADKELRKLAEYDVPGTEWQSVILSISPAGRE